jgi:replicative DNA helicase
MTEMPHPGSDPSLGSGTSPDPHYAAQLDGGFGPGYAAGAESGADSGYAPPRTPYEAEALRIPPHSVQAEQSLLGALMQGGSAWERIADQVVESDFYRREHRVIFAAIKSLAEQDEPCDLVTLAESLERRETLDDAGGLPYVGRMVQGSSSVSNIEAYAKIVRYHSVLRQLIAAGTDIADIAYNPKDRKPAELLDEAESKVFAIAEQLARGGGGFRHVKPLLIKAIERIDQLQNSNNAITGLPTGFADFDEKTSGLQNSDLIIVAGRPSMGKTSFAMNLAENVAIETQRPVAVFSMEMPGDSLAMRMMSSLGRIDQHRVRTGKLEDDEWPRLTSAVNMLSKTKIYIDDTPALSPTEVRARARRLKREQGDLAMIVLDYLQLMQAPDVKENRVAEISAISRSLKALAKELDIPVIALSQLNRSLEQRPNKRPVMSDLRESGAIEQDADIIVFIYRDEVYHEDSKDKGIAEIIIAKQRNGPIGTTRLTFLGKYTKFENFVDNYYGDPG